MTLSRRLRVVGLVAAAALLGTCARRVPAPAASGPTAASENPFTLVAIGDTGSVTQDLYDNAVGVAREIQKGKPRQRALVFLGDNFYEYGLSKNPINIRERRYRAIYEDLFGAVMRTLAQDGCADGAAGECPAGTVNYVHAVAGNHDYYSGALALAGVNVLPTGFSTEGNEYCRIRGLLTPEETAELAKKNVIGPSAPPSRGAAANPSTPAKPSRPWHWRYHFDLPQHEYWPLDPEKPGGPEIHVVFFDSASLVRAAENCGQRKLKCPGVPVDEDNPEDPLSCVRAEAALCRLQEHLDSEKEHSDVRWRVFVAHHPFWTVGAHGGYAWSAIDGEAVWTNLCSKSVDPQGWFKNTQFDPEDACSHGWKWYLDQLAVVMKGRPPFDLAIAGHDHSLQLIQPGGREPSPLARVQVVSGAGCKSAVVRGPGTRQKPLPALDRVYTASAGGEGESKTGFASLRFYPERVELQFFSGWRAIPARAMASADEAAQWEGRSCFVVTRAGSLDPGAECQW
jgi:hypothetical protein